VYAFHSADASVLRRSKKLMMFAGSAARWCLWRAIHSMAKAGRTLA
jgi:hypothetical protein